MTASQIINVAKNKNAPVESPQDFSGANFANHSESVTTIEPHSTRDSSSINKSATMDVDDVQSKLSNDSIDTVEISTVIEGGCRH